MVHFMAFSFFSIPEFRREVLALIQESESEQLYIEDEIQMILLNWD